MTIDYVSDKPLRYPRFEVEVDDLGETGIYILDTECTGELPDVMPARGTVVCETGPINLTPGRCYINLAVLKGDVMADNIKHAAHVDVEAENFYPSGYMPDRDWALCVIGQKWSTL